MAVKTDYFKYKKNKKEVISKDETDSVFTISHIKYWISKTTTGAPAGDHLLQIANNKVSCDGRLFTNSSSSEFKFYTGHTGTAKVCVIHCVSGPHKDNLLQIKNTGEISFRRPTSIEVFTQQATLNFSDVGSDVLFEYTNDSFGLFRFRLHRNNNLVLGFSDSGVPTSSYVYGSNHTLFHKQPVVMW